MAEFIISVKTSVDMKRIAKACTSGKELLVACVPHKEIARLN